MPFTIHKDRRKSGMRKHGFSSFALCILCGVGFTLTPTLASAGWVAQNAGTTNYLCSVYFPMDAQTGYAVGQNGTPIPPEYHSVEETWAVLDSLHRLYPAITKLDTCGYSQRFLMPIPHLVISRNPGTREDEPSALLTGVTHPREPMGNEICLYTMRWILQNYPDSAWARRWVDSMDVHFVPIVNPEGYQYVIDSTSGWPWWGKNLRDNRGNGGRIHPDSDGVNINRNFDWRWDQAGSGACTSDLSRGPSPASESETQALMNLATQRKFVVGISYHSFGYLVCLPWFYDTLYTPDDATLREMASNMGNQIGGYTPYWLRGASYSSVWFYGQLGMYDFSVETGKSFIPPAESIAIECEKNIRGAAYLLDRTFYSGVTGHVRDSLTLEPLVATVEVLDLAGDSIVPRTSDSLYGRFYRLLQFGRTYSLSFSKTGYETKTIENLWVPFDSLTTVEVLLASASGVGERGEAARGVTRYKVWPNPFTSFATLPGHEAERFSLYDVSGRKVGTYRGDRVGEGLAPGVYFLRSSGSKDKPLRIVKVR